MLELLPRYHSIYEGGEGELLLRIFDEYAGGQFRQWAKFTRSAAKLCEQRGLPTITEPIVDAVFRIS